MKTEKTVLSIQDLVVSYGSNQVLNNIFMDIQKNSATALMGPSGCGKTTLIRCVNRMHEINTDVTIKGKIMLNGDDILSLNPIEVRRRIGMVFQKPNPFPTMSIYNNVLAGYRLSGTKMKKNLADEIVESSLNKAALWDEVKDSLFKKGTFLSGGQQQRLCIARALAMKPDILLLDEPTSALDPKATSRIEELIAELKNNVTILMVTHNIAQAGRISDYTSFLYLGDLVEYGPTQKLFTTPEDSRTEEYLTGKFG